MGRPISELEPWERCDYLDKLGLTERDPVVVALRDPVLARRIKAQPTWDGKVKAALRAYAEEGHPWPEEPVAYLTHLVVSAPDLEPSTSPELLAPRRWTLAGGQIRLAGRPFPSKDGEEVEAPRSAGGWRVVPGGVQFPPLDDAEEGVDDQLEQVIALLAREQHPAKGAPGPKPKDPPARTKRRIAELRITGARVAEIMRDTGLSKTVATRLVRDVDAALGAIRAGRY
jgi:hypothetical protein